MFPNPKNESAPKPPGRCENEVWTAELLKLLRHDGELQLGLGERLDHQAFGQFGGGVLGGSHFADEQVLGSLQHFLFTEGEGLAAAEGNEALEDGGDFNQRSRAHALGILLEAMLPVRMRVKFALFEEAQDLVGFVRANNRP